MRRVPYGGEPGIMRHSREEILRLRAANKQRMQEVFAKWESLPETKRHKENVGLSHIRLMPTVEAHTEEVVAMLCYQFSLMGNQFHNTIFLATIEDVLPRFLVMLQHAVDTGLCVSAVDDTTGRVVAFVSQNDLLDPPPYTDLSLQKQPNRLWPKSQLMRTLQVPLMAYQGRYMNLYVAKQLPLVKDLYDDFIPGDWELPISNKVAYGEVMYKDCACVRPDMGNQGIMQLLLTDTCDKLGYKLAYGVATNPITIGINRRLPSATYQTALVDVSGVTFPDGATMEQFMEKLITKQQWTTEYVESLRKRAVLRGLVHIYGPKWRVQTLGLRRELVYRGLYRKEMAEEERRRAAAGLAKL